MKLSELRTRVKIQTPNISGVDDDAINSLINKGCDEVNLYCKVYKGYTDFNIVANQMIYQLSVVAPFFLGMDNKVVYFKDANGQWQDLIPKTKVWIQKYYPDFLNVSSVAVPQWYFQEADELGFYQPPSTSLANGARVYHLKRRTDMGSDDAYPFSGGATEITALSPCDDAIIAYCRWKLSPAVGAVTDTDLRKAEFIAECARASKQIKRRPDIAIDHGFSINV